MRTNDHELPADTPGTLLQVVVVVVAVVASAPRDDDTQPAQQAAREFYAPLAPDAADEGVAEVPHPACDHRT